MSSSIINYPTLGCRSDSKGKGQRRQNEAWAFSWQTVRVAFALAFASRTRNRMSGPLHRIPLRQAIVRDEMRETSM